MIHALSHLNTIAVGVVSVIGFLMGALWYSPLLFVRAWMAELKLTPEEMKAGCANPGCRMASVFVLTVVSTLCLAVLVASHRSSGALKGAELGLLVGAGIVATRQAGHGLFERQSLRHFLIGAGFDVVVCVVQGAILGVWR